MSNNRKLRVFLCHSSDDKPAVRELYGRLKSEGWIDPWLDEEDLLPGQKWHNEISKAVEEAHLVIAMLSCGAVSKEGYIQKELKIALDVALEKPDETIFIIPLRLDDCDVPYSIRKFHWLDYFPKIRQERAYRKLLESLTLRAKELDLSSITHLKSKVKHQKPEESVIDFDTQNILIPSFPIYTRVTAGPRGEANLGESLEMAKSIDEFLQVSFDLAFRQI
jgi:hypothetical protein